MARALVLRPLLAGIYAYHREIEEKIAKFFHRDSANDEDGTTYCFKIYGNPKFNAVKECLWAKQQNTNTDFVDIFGCDGYMTDQRGFEVTFNQTDGSVVHMAAAVGKHGLPWLVGEWGIDEDCGDKYWKANTLKDMMLKLNTATYRNCVWMAIWPYGTKANDNRWNSSSKDTSVPGCKYTPPDDKSISAKAFIAILSKGIVLPDKRPHIWQ